MQQLQPVIRKLKTHFGSHPLFARMKTAQPDLRKALAFAPPAAFWVLAFQDVIRLNARRANAPEIRSLLEHHAREDAGHERWFLDDIQTAYGELFTTPHSIFSAETLEIRELVYGIVGESLSLSDDKLRLIYVDLLESTAQVFFGHVLEFLRKSGHFHHLKYFGAMRRDAESSHEVFEDSHKKQILSYDLNKAQRTEAEALAIRIFGRFDGLATQLQKHFDQQQHVEMGWTYSTDPAAATA